MTSTTSAGPSTSQPPQQAPLVATPQKTQQTTFFSSVFSPQVSTYFIAGGVAGAASRTVVSPLERIKIIQSVQLPSRGQIFDNDLSFVTTDKYNLSRGVRSNTEASGAVW